MKSVVHYLRLWAQNTSLVFAALCQLIVCGALVSDSWAETPAFASDAETRKYALILVGASYAEEDRQRFQQWGRELRRSLLNDYGYVANRVTLLLGEVPAGEKDSDGVCDATTIAERFQQLTQELRPNDQLNIVLIGHGTGAGRQAKFNSVGPDYNGVQFNELLATLPTQNLVVVNTTAASHDFTQALAAPGRVLVSATRSAAEKYQTLFPAYWLEGLQEKQADRDKNGRVSVLESFRYAKTQVNHHYRQQNSLPSEHAVLGDSGEANFSHTPRGAMGQLAEVAYFDPVPGQVQNLSPRARELRANMEQLERHIFSLRNAKQDLPEADYWARLETLLIELAQTSRDYRRLTQ